jgi:biopolymer transport protein ExbD
MVDGSRGSIRQTVTVHHTAYDSISVRTIALCVLFTVLTACRGNEHKRQQAVGRSAEDVPSLSSLDGTAEPARAPIIAITPEHISAEGVGRFPPDPTNAKVKSALRAHSTAEVVSVAADRALPNARVAPLFDEMQLAGIRRVQLLVMVGRESRSLSIELPRATAAGAAVSIAIVSVDDSKITVNDMAVAPSQLAATIRSAHPDQVVVLLSPNATMQTLAEVAAAAGGHITLGGAALPRVEPVRAP